MPKTRNRGPYTLNGLAANTGGTVEGDGSVVISGVAGIERAGPDEITFVANDRYLKYLDTTQAGAVITGPGVKCSRIPLLRHPEPYLTYARVVDLLYPDDAAQQPGIHPTAVIEDGATVDPTASIGSLCHIGAGSTIGRNCTLLSSVTVGREVQVGDECLVYPGVRILDGSRIGSRVIIHPSAVIGSDGFGFARSEQGFKKIKQIGWVEISDDVEIGAGTCIDRGALGPTRIGRGTKIDNLVQIAHNVEIGQNTIIVSQVGISGSTRIGDGVVLAGQVGIVGHIDIGDGVKIGAQSGVSKSVPAGKTVFGYPAREIMETKRIEAALLKLPDLLKRVKKLEQDREK